MVFWQCTGEDNELGREKSVDEYISNILKITNECHKHMAPTGSLFINVGDSFKNNGRTLVPERLTIALNDSKPKWHVVQTLIWDKATTAIPEGKVKRFNSSYEEIIWCVKDSKNYYFDSDQIREPYKTKGATSGKPPRHHEKPTKSKSKRGSDDKIVRGYSYRWNKSVSSSLKHPLGKMKRDILRVNRATTQSIDFGGNVKHTSIMPVELVDTILAGVIRPGMLVVDPTCGSGTTGVSALGFGAYFGGYDLNDSFLELANHRMEQRLNELMEQ
ncbi:MAG: site-specific DNA-methyltransferase [Bacteroidetes Order II. Incertae sedis bacterium]|nr:site-specific DNA-methyltransferase [Bacteroidetes Order II. bacterium]MBT4980285.1 site-specific DNA-methyltransferase [Gemmatimonadota bacterium]